MTTVVVLGAGALGSVYGAWFAEAGAEVTLVARPAHAEAVNRDGLRIDDRSPVAVKAVVDPADAGDCDILLLASKAFDNAELLNGYRGSAQAAFSVQNGVRQAEPLVARFGPAAVGCVSLVGRNAGRARPCPSHLRRSHTAGRSAPLPCRARQPPSPELCLAAAWRFTTTSPPRCGPKECWPRPPWGVVGLTRLVYHRVFPHA